MTAWPLYARVAADGYGLRRDRDVDRTPWDDGMIRQARRYTAALETRRVTVALDSDADLARFREWTREHAAGWFAWTDPEDGVTRRARVRGGAAGVEYAAAVRAGRRTWEARLELEGLPGDVAAAG